MKKYFVIHNSDGSPTCTYLGEFPNYRAAWTPGVTVARDSGALILDLEGIEDLRSSIGVALRVVEADEKGA